VSDSKLPERPSLEYLKKLAKDRLQELRRIDPQTKLADVLLSISRDYGFPSWRALKAEIERIERGDVAPFFEACEKGDATRLRELLARNPSLARAENPKAQHHGWTGLHAAAQAGHTTAVRFLLDYGADPNAREAGDNTYPLHWAAARKDVEMVRALLDAGGDVHGSGDVHELDVIGWAAVYREPGDDPSGVVALLVERGARHHIFSAISLGDRGLIRKLVKENPATLNRRMSRFEDRQSALHFTIQRRHYDILDLLIELGADLEAEDHHGHTALAVAMMRGDREAISRLHAAGAKGNKGWTVASVAPKPADSPSFAAAVGKLARSIRKGVPMIRVPDIAQTLDWYTSIGFTEIGRVRNGTSVDWGMASFGKAQLMFMPGKADPQAVRLWFYTSRIDRLHQLFKSRLVQSAQAALSGSPAGDPRIEIIEDLYDPPYGGREFGIRDLNGYALYFMQERMIGKRVSIAMDSKTLDRYAGIYQLGSMVVTIANENGHLMVEPKGQKKLEALPSAEHQFFIDEVNAVLKFATGPAGETTGFEFSQGGQTMFLKRLG
jgi:ankyrin repeat protein